MSTNPNPYRDNYPFGHLQIGGVEMPGIITSVDGAEKVETWVFQKGLAANNAVSIWRGRGLAENIEIVCRVFDEKSFDACYTVRDALRPNWKRPPVLPILNGALNFNRITRVALKNLVPPKPAPGLSWEYKIVVVEYNPMRPVPVGPADPPKAITENDRLEQQFSSLLAQAPSLFGN
jgi:hypothetical protein